MKKKIFILPLMTFMFMSAFAATSIGTNPSAVFAQAQDIVGTHTIIILDDGIEAATYVSITGNDDCKYDFYLSTTEPLISGKTYTFSDMNLAWRFDAATGGSGICEYAEEATLCVDASGNITVTMITNMDGDYSIYSEPAKIFASLEELVTKLPATNTAQKVTVTITDAVIDDLFLNYTGHINGIFVTAASTTIEIHFNDVPLTWRVGGKVSGTITAEWRLYDDVPELRKWEGGWSAFTYTAPVVWPADAPTEAPAAPTYGGVSLLGAPLTTNLEFEPLDWPGSMPEKLTFETGETIYFLDQMNWQIYTNWAEDSYNMSEYDMLHVDLFPASGTQIKVEIEGLRIDDGGQGYKNYVVKTLTAGEWNSLDIALSEFPALSSGDAYDFSDVRYFILEGYNAEETALSVGNVYFYKAPHVHAIKTTHAKVETKCVEAGHKAYYECSCGKFFSDEALTEEIPDRDVWLAIEGRGYIAPLGHKFTGTVNYEWSADHSNCTASIICANDGCSEALTETVKSVYVKDSDATTESNEKGHYEATFTNANFAKQVTAANSVEKEGTKLLPEPVEPAEEKDLSAGAIVGIVVGSVFGLLIIAFVVLYILWKCKNLNVPILSKVLTPAFRFINKLFFKTELNDVEAKEAENKPMKE